VCVCIYIYNLFSKNDKLIFKERIATTITTTNYNFEETFENVFSE